MTKLAYDSQGGTLKGTYYYNYSNMTQAFAMLRTSADSDGSLYIAFAAYDASGRVTFQKGYSDAAGTVFVASYRMTYHGATTRIDQKTRYSDAAGTTLVATYTYVNDAQNRLAT